jgi:diphthamide synthase (EF-2-diphthine--ammonia ligase)
MTRPKVLPSWSSGKDSAWALHVLRRQPVIEIVGLLTTFNEAFDRVAMHAVQRELVEAQAAETRLPLDSVILSRLGVKPKPQQCLCRPEG